MFCGNYPQNCCSLNTWNAKDNRHRGKCPSPATNFPASTTSVYSGSCILQGSNPWSQVLRAPLNHSATWDLKIALLKFKPMCAALLWLALTSSLAIVFQCCIQLVSRWLSSSNILISSVGMRLSKRTSLSFRNYFEYAPARFISARKFFHQVSE